jgi:alpha-1,2-mannosyltransferase
VRIARSSSHPVSEAGPVPPRPIDTGEVVAPHRRAFSPAALLAAATLTVAATAGWLFQWSYMWGYVGLAESDLVIFRAAGRAVVDGVPLYSLWFEDVGGWTWPPFGALLMVPLTVIPDGLLMPLAYVANAACLAAVVWTCSAPLRDRLASTTPRVLAVGALTLVAAALTPVADVFGLGQIGLVLLLLCTLDLVVLAGSAPRAHGVLVGIAAAIKITPALFIIHFLITRQWRAAATATLTVLVCWSAAALVLWDDTVQYWSQALLFRVNERISDFGSWVYNQSWMGLVDGLPRPLPVILWAALSALTLVVALRAAARAHRSAAPVLVLGLVGLASVLVTPVAWHHHAVWVVPALLALLGDARAKWRTAGAAVLAVLLMVPSRFPSGVPDIYVVLYVVLGVMLLALAPARRPRSSDM